jgi:hypothetical protein
MRASSLFEHQKSANPLVGRKLSVFERKFLTLLAEYKVSLCYHLLKSSLSLLVYLLLLSVAFLKICIDST